MKTAVAQTQANDFLEEGSLHLQVQQDTYTHTTIKRTRRKEEDDNEKSGAHSDGYGGKRGGSGSGF